MKIFLILNNSKFLNKFKKILQVFTVNSKFLILCLSGIISQKASLPNFSQFFFSLTSLLLLKILRSNFWLLRSLSQNFFRSFFSNTRWEFAKYFLQYQTRSKFSLLQIFLSFKALITHITCCTRSLSLSLFLSHNIFCYASKFLCVFCIFGS